MRVRCPYESSLSPEHHRSVFTEKPIAAGFEERLSNQTPQQTGRLLTHCHVFSTPPLAAWQYDAVLVCGGVR
uniref:Oxidoreductase n=1 Tax=Mesocestoides corti TaxID=53468 RepID=A0A5K3FKH7_MESCO